MDLTSVVEEGQLLSFVPLQGSTTGVRVVDHVERRRCTLATPSEVRPREVPEEEFYFPVDRGVSITTSRLTLQHTVGVYVRNHAGMMVDELSKGDSRTFPDDAYNINFSTPIKLYAAFESDFSIDVTTDDVTLEFDEPIEVLLGARSHHEVPAATIRTTGEPEDVMAAVSYLGSALKTTSVERSYPTLRGHPPEIELAEEFHAPEVLERPEAGVRIEVPSNLRHVYVVAPLAYYFGAEVVPGDVPRLVGEGGFAHDLIHPERGFEGEVERVLKQAFFLDCVTRTEGYYPVDLHERNEIEDEVNLDFPDLYGRSLSEQLDAYLDVPFSVVEPHVPQWKLTAHVGDVPENVEAIPFVLNDLAIVRSAEGEPVSKEEAASAGMQGFFSRSSGATPDSPSPDLLESSDSSDFATGLIRSASGHRSGNDLPEGDDDDAGEDTEIYRVEGSDALEQAWISEGIPLGASKAMIQAYRNRLHRSLTQGDIDITVVMNDEEMEEESDLVDEIYGSREDLPFDVEVHRHLTREELQEVLQEQTEFLHYIGHIDAGGFECPDGMFDANTLEETGVEAFFLNACSSYRQGMALIDAGAIAGVVTFADVINSGAERIGKNLAKLLNRGFPLRPALNIAKKESIMGGYYLVIGDGGLDIAQPETGTPVMLNLSHKEGDCDVRYYTYPTRDRGIGSIRIPYIDDNQEYYLLSGLIDVFSLDRDSLNSIMSEFEEIPVEHNGSLGWSNEIQF